MWDLIHEPSWETRPVLRLDNFRAEAMMNLYTEARVLYMKMATYLEMWGMEVRKLNWLMALSKTQWVHLGKAYIRSGPYEVGYQMALFFPDVRPDFFNQLVWLFINLNHSPDLICGCTICAQGRGLTNRPREVRLPQLIKKSKMEDWKPLPSPPDMEIYLQAKKREMEKASSSTEM